MDAGTRVRNQHGTTQIGQDYANFVLDGGRKNFSVINRPIGFTQNSNPPAGTVADSIIVTDNLLDEPYFGWNWGYCWVFKPADQVAVGGVAGKRVRNPYTGKLTFDSSHKYFRVVDYIRTGSNLSRTYPAGRKYRVAPLSWKGLDIIRDVGDAGWGDGSRLYRQEWRCMQYQLVNNTLTLTIKTNLDNEVWDGPSGMAGTIGADPFLELLVIDMTGYPGVT